MQNEYSKLNKRQAETCKLYVESIQEDLFKSKQDVLQEAGYTYKTAVVMRGDFFKSKKIKAYIQHLFDNWPEEYEKIKVERALKAAKDNLEFAREMGNVSGVNDAMKVIIDLERNGLQSQKKKRRSKASPRQNNINISMADKKRLMGG